MKSTTVTLGKQAEDKACQYLKKQGLKLIQRNYRCRLGEIDLIMRDKETLVFVEVRMRTSKNFSSALESIDQYKQKKIIKTALYYLQEHNLISKISCRFDVVALDSISGQLTWIDQAFDT